MVYRPTDRVVRYAALPAAAVTLAALRDQCRVSHTEEDVLLTGFAMAATAAVERWTQRLLIRREAVLHLPGLPGGTCAVELPGGVVPAVISVTADAVAITGCTAIGDSPAVLVPAGDWPVVTGTGWPVEIVYEAGFDAVPGDLEVAVKMIAGEMYDRRSEGVDVQIQRAIVSAEWLMKPHRIAPR